MITGVDLSCGFCLMSAQGLIPVEPRHHDVDEDHLRLMIGDLGSASKPSFGQDDFIARLAQNSSALRRIVLLSSITSTLMAPAGDA